MSDPSNRPRRPTPRPTYPNATVVKKEDAASHLWGDSASGFVSDRVYLSDDTLHVLRYELGPHRRFVHSATNPTFFAADITYIVLEGDLWIADPSSGEVQKASAGELVFMQRDTWHHVFNPNPTPVRVLEFFAPPPSRGTASTYAHKQPLLTETRYDDPRWHRRWPEAKDEQRIASRLSVLGLDDVRWTILDTHAEHVEGVAVDTEFLTVSYGEVIGGFLSEELTAADHSVLYLTSGSLHILLPDVPHDQQAWHELVPGDIAFLPQGTPFRLVDQQGHGARYWLGAARPVPEDWTP